MCISHTQAEPQALECNKTETFNKSLFQKLGTSNIGILGLTVPESYNGTGFADATAVAIAHEELSYADDEEKRGWVLNGTKMWITNGTITGNETGGIFLVYAVRKCRKM
mmetsp:Transcript_31162/g.45618  ORF Transcript_31162/g.45618 Transcript_31162/m.45618 type:complete len:109 (+) Transcript_31162:191-517(+)